MSMGGCKRPKPCIPRSSKFYKLSRQAKICIRSKIQNRSFLEGFFRHSRQNNCLKMVDLSINQPVRLYVFQESTFFVDFELHPLLSYFSSPRLEYSLGHKAGQLLFQLEKSCELSKSKKKKRNKKNKERQAVEEQRSQPFDEDQLALNSLIESVDWVKQQKEPCVVSEEWLLRISKRKDALKK